MRWIVVGEMHVMWFEFENVEVLVINPLTTDGRTDRRYTIAIPSYALYASRGKNAYARKTVRVASYRVPHSELNDRLAIPCTPICYS